MKMVLTLFWYWDHRFPDHFSVVLPLCCSCTSILAMTLQNSHLYLMIYLPLKWCKRQWMHRWTLAERFDIALSHPCWTFPDQPQDCGYMCKQRHCYHILYSNYDQTLVNSLHRLLKCEIGGLDCRIITTEYGRHVHCIHM